MPCIDYKVDRSPRIDVGTGVESRIKYEPEKPVKVEPVKPEMPEETEVKTEDVKGETKRKENVALVIMRKDVKIDLLVFVIVVICVYLLAKFLR